jgi:hypothetical protein
LGSDDLGQFNVPASLQAPSPQSQPILLPRRASLPTDAPLANVETSDSISSIQETNSGSNPIRPTNLTGRIVKIDNFPVDEGGFSSIYKGDFDSTKASCTDPAFYIPEFF